MQRNELAALRRRVEAALPEVRYLVPDHLADFAAGMMCDRHRRGRECDADCEDVAREILALTYLYNPYASPTDHCLACELSNSEVCVFHEGWDQAVLQEIADSFAAGSRRRPWRAFKTWCRYAVGAIRKAWWPDKLLSGVHLLLGVACAVVVPWSGVSPWWLFITVPAAIGWWYLALVNLAWIRPGKHRR